MPKLKWQQLIKYTFDLENKNESIEKSHHYSVGSPNLFIINNN